MNPPSSFQNASKPAKAEWFEQLVCNTDYGITFADANRKIEWVNDSFTRLCGYTRDEVRGRNLSFLQGEGTDQKTVTRIRTALNEGRKIKAKILNYTKLGDEYWVDLEIFPRLDEKGSVAGYFCISRPITGNIETVDGIQLMRARQSTINQATLDGLLFLNENGYILDVSPSYCNMTGYSFSDLLEKNISDFETEENKEQLNSHIRTIIALGKDCFETKLRRRDGSTMHVQVSTQYDSEEKAFILIFKDLTEQKLALQKIARLTTFYRAINECNEAILYSKSREELFQDICRIVVCFGNMKMAWVGKPDPSTGLVHSLAIYGEGKEYLNNIMISTNRELPEGQGPVGTALRENRPIWVEDFSHHPMMLPWRVRAEPFGWKSAAAIPFGLVSKHDEVLTFYGGHELGFGDDVRELLVRMVKNISFVLDNFSQ